MLLYQICQKFFLSHKKSIVSLVIFLLIFIALGLPYHQWGIEIDDCANLFSVKNISLSNMGSLFYAKDLRFILMPSNYLLPQQSFFSAFYRPLARVFYAAQYYAFGNQFFDYYLVAIALHAINAVLLFHLFASFVVSYGWAFWGALFFGFHATLGGWIGWISTPFYSLSLTFLLFALMLFFTYLKRKKNIFLFYSLLSYAISLLLFEISIFFPIFLSSFLLMYSFLKKQYPYVPAPWVYVKKTIGFWGITACFFALRLMLFPLSLSTAKQPSFGLPLLESFKSHVYMLSTTLAADLGNFSWIASNHRLLKGSILLMLLCCVVWLMYNNRNKKVLFFLFFSMSLFMWPAIRFYRPRYIYFALGLFTAWLLILLGADEKALGLKKKMRYVIYFCGYAILILNLGLIKTNLRARELASSKNLMLIQELLSNPVLHKKALCFIGLPKKFYNSSLAPSIWCLLPEQFPVYYDPETFINSDSLQHNIRILPIKNGYRLTLENKNTEFIDYAELCHKDYSFANGSFTMGTIIKHAHNDSGGVYDMSYIFDKKYLEQNMIFISWDYDRACFMIVPPPELD